MSNTYLNSCYICDIDGTLANMDGKRGPFEEHKVHLDIPHPTCELINLIVASDIKVIFFSGRTKKCQETTREWLFTHIPYLLEDDFQLYMREIGDFRPDEIVKEELYNTYVKDKYRVLGVFDDRQKVVSMWIRLGLWVFDVSQQKGNF